MDRSLHQAIAPEQSSTTRSFAAESARDHLTDFSRGARTSSGKRYSYMPLKVQINVFMLLKVSLLGIVALWGNCIFIPADLGP